jgi:hypothetical protein
MWHQYRIGDHPCLPPKQKLLRFCGILRVCAALPKSFRIKSENLEEEKYFSRKGAKAQRKPLIKRGSALPFAPWREIAFLLKPLFVQRRPAL